MTSYLSRLSPVPSFPEYTGPYKVGTVDVELSVSELDSPSPPPDETISTVQYRIFYPCDPEAKGKRINWIPSPQRGYVSAYTKFIGAGHALADVLSYLPNHLCYISIPVRKNATLLEPPTENKRWPVMIFSHGLGGSRNAYSHLVGSLASHGMIVIAPEHRDGSTPISYIRDVPSNNSISEKSSARKSKRTVSYVRLPHTPSPEVEAGRDAQLKVRLWELGVIHDSLLKLDLGISLNNLNTSFTNLSSFQNVMDVHSPGKIAFAGHSFGAATVTQFIKSTFYSPLTSTAPPTYKPLFTPTLLSPISSQITPETPIILLDAWCLPLRSAATRWLWNMPFPSYSTPTSPGGSVLLAIESHAFYKWSHHLAVTKRLLSPNPSSSFADYTILSNSDSTDTPSTFPQPNFYYTPTSAHLSQSDFGLLFPWVTKRFLGCEEPERVMRLNVRAITQLLRYNSIQVAATSIEDLETAELSDTDHDTHILSMEDDVRGWKFISTTGEDLGDLSDDETGSDSDTASQAKEREISKFEDVTEPSQAVLKNEVLSPKAEKL